MVAGLRGWILDSGQSARGRVDSHAVRRERSWHTLPAVCGEWPWPCRDGEQESTETDRLRGVGREPESCSEGACVSEAPWAAAGQDQRLGGGFLGGLTLILLEVDHGDVYD